ncbi:class I adenylate-forming enzyme family protein [Agromyces intestinalis]|uniref:class I adenylate-forming enzyme family protein n=1 Tax=Agromyces intestinalis TaxID=2592652 RepID=UPI00143D5105|nr:AMP-binding protein [Agromyces intestinalis]
MSDWLGGRGASPALRFGGRTVSYRELGRAVDEARLPDGAIGCAAGADPVETAVTVLAALDRGRAVLIGGGRADVAALGDAQAGILVRTSGSSGTARTITRTSASWLASAAPLAELTGTGPADRVAVTGPLHVSMHLYATLHALWSGACATDDVADASVVHATPTRLQRLLGEHDVPDTIVVAGAPLGEHAASRAASRGIRVVEYYGAAELSFVAAGAGDGTLSPFPGVEVELRGDGRSRTVWARSPYLADGYLGTPGALRRDDRGFASVGDLAEPVAPGRFRVVGRGDAAITTAGATVLAEPIEAVVRDLPGVLEAVVVGVPDAVLGERVVAVVELADRGDPTAVAADVLEQAVRARLAPEEHPRRWYRADRLPRTDGGKIARGEVHRLLAADGFTRLGSADEPRSEPPAAATSRAVR